MLDSPHQYPYNRRGQSHRHKPVFVPCLKLYGWMTYLAITRFSSCPAIFKIDFKTLFMNTFKLRSLVAILFLTACSAATQPASSEQAATQEPRLAAPTQPPVATPVKEPIPAATTASISPLVSVVIPTTQPPDVILAPAKGNATESAPSAAGDCAKPFEIKAIDNTYLYYLPTQSSYARAKPDRCFLTEAAAESAAFKKAPGK